MLPRILAVGMLCGTCFAADPVEFKVGAFTFDRPSGWAWIVPASPMRKAQLALTKEGAGTVETVFFHFGPGQGGSVQANIDRWVGQFQNGTSDTKQERLGTSDVTFVTATGTFASGMPGGPTTPLENYGMIAAILPSDQGDVYVKATGPSAAIEAAKPDFKKLITSAATR
jgi:hypothetical protein